MLAQPSQAVTPRPRPPAKVRRAVSAQVNSNSGATPPPSYASAFTYPPRAADGRPQPRLDTLLGSPMSATFKRVGWDAMSDGTEQPPPTEADTEWTQEKSREELSELLGKADYIIRERETELSHTAAVCRSLHENNVSLKHKHQILLSRLPHSPLASPALSTTPLSRTPTYGSSGISRSTSDSVISASNSPHLSWRGHTRKISVTPGDISLLADQNAELLCKLEKLEAESSIADNSGRRVLKKLEKEISVLRVELEKTQAKSEELEEKAKSGWGAERAVEEVWRKKKEREAKFRAMRNNSGQEASDDSLDESEIRDFAPSGSVFGFPSGTGGSPDSRGQLISSSSSFWTPSAPATLPTQSSFAFNKSGRMDQLSPFAIPENSLISQLLSKIQELEDTNTRIIEQQIETTTQLQAVQRETEHISRVYDAIDDQASFELELVSDKVPDNGVHNDNILSEDTIRFRSVRRSAEDRADGTLPSDTTTRPSNTGFSHKPRKSVVGLFDGSQSEESPAINIAQPKPYSLPVPFSLGHRNSWSVGSSGLASPALSSLSLASPLSRLQPELSPIDSSRPTLDDELAGEFSRTWGFNNRSHHMRANSLYDLAHMSAISSPSPSPMGSRKHSPAPSEDHPTLPTPESMAHNVLRLSVEPPTPDKFQTETDMLSVGRASARYQRMTQTVRSRTNRWVDGRFTDSFSGMTHLSDAGSDDAERTPAAAIVRPLTPLPIRLASAIDAVMENFTGSLSAKDNPGSPQEERDERHQDQQVDSAAANGTRQPKQQGMVGFVLEIWLWLQFVIIILVFLWAMAKRGPKSVLNEAEQRRAVASRR